MKEETNIDKLSIKVTQILVKYDAMKEENISMRNELLALKAQTQLKNAEIEKLSNELSMKDQDIEDVIRKIESTLE